MTMRALPTLALAATLLATSTASAAPGVSATPAPTAAAKPRVTARQVTKLEAKNAAAVPGETRTLEATLTTAGKPVAGKTVRFRIEGKDGTSVPGGAIEAGSAVTGEDGKAKLAFAVPELAQGAYRLKAIFAGDTQAMSSNDDANFGLIKGITKLELGDLIWGTYKNEPGSPTGTVMVRLSRASDGKALAKPVSVTVNGKTWTIGGPGSLIMMLPLPTNATSWTVKAQFEGDDANQASSAERSYSKPK